MLCLVTEVADPVTDNQQMALLIVIVIVDVPIAAHRHQKRDTEPKFNVYKL
jgi:hypothetical protein